MLLFSILFAVLVANLTLIMVVQAERLPEHAGQQPHAWPARHGPNAAPYPPTTAPCWPRARRTQTARTTRVYPAGDLASHVVGYASTQYGTSGIEAAYNDTLKGQQNFASWTDVVELAGRHQHARQRRGAHAQLQDPAGGPGRAGRRSGRLRGHGPRNRRRAGAWPRRPPTTRRTCESAHQADTDRRLGAASCTTAPRRRSTRPAPRSRWSPSPRPSQDGVTTEDTEYHVAQASWRSATRKVTNVDNNEYGTISLRPRHRSLVEHRVRPGGRPAGSRTPGGGRRGLRLQRQDRLRFAAGHVPHARSRRDDRRGKRPGPPPESRWARTRLTTVPAPPALKRPCWKWPWWDAAIANEGTIMQPYLVDGIYNANGDAQLHRTRPPSCMQAVVGGDGRERVTEGAGGRRVQRHVAPLAAVDGRGPWQARRAPARTRRRDGRQLVRRASPPPRTHAWWLPSPSRNSRRFGQGREFRRRESSERVENRPCKCKGLV